MFLNDVLQGLSHQPKTLPPKWLYDSIGANLFERICEIPEYYLTRTELGILKKAAPDIAQELGSTVVLVEYGSGAMTKVRLLLDFLDTPHAFIAIDIASEQLIKSAMNLKIAYPDLLVQTVAKDFTDIISLPKWIHSAGRCCAFLPGSTIGNFEPDEAQDFLQSIHHVVGQEGALLIGVDLMKDQRCLEAAYNDNAGLTALFNKNILRRINHELNGNIDINSFQHLAWFNASKSRVEMHLKSCLAQNFRIGEQEFHFQPGETIHTENCYKFTIQEFQSIAKNSGFRPARVWTDADNLFSIHLLNAR